MLVGLNSLIDINEKEFLQNHLYLLKEIEGCMIKEVNETDTHFEFVYLKDDKLKCLVLACCGLHHKFSETQYTKFEISTKPLFPSFEATSCNRMSTQYTLQKSESFETLGKIKKMSFHNKLEAYFDTDTLVIEGETKDGDSLNYFIDIQLYESPLVTTSKYIFLTELGVEHTIAEHGYISFSNATDILSQWYKCEFEDESANVYNSCEQYMMAQKAKLFWDDKIYKKIMNETNMKTIKELGKKVHYFEQESWDEYKEQIVYEANFLKFSQNEELKRFLLSTDEKMIVEVNPNDIVWACGYFEKDAKNPDLWRGKNLLGQILMQVRKNLKKDRC